MAKHHHPELEGQESQPLYSFQLKKRGQAAREKVGWTIVGLLTGLGIAIAGSLLWPQGQPSIRSLAKSPVGAEEDTFKQGVNHAMQAAELTQSAEFREDWASVALQWQYAINHMQSVPKDHADHAVAQQKLAEYDRNLQYAQSNVTTRAARQPATPDYWTVGSNRELVVALQGVPQRISQYPNSCSETWHYGHSLVELHNGYVTQYDDFDSHLKVLETDHVAQSIQPPPGYWSLGSSRDEVAQIQGTPNRTGGSASATLSTLYYGDSSVFLEDERVIGYLNVDGNLKISTEMVPGASPPSLGQSWSLGSTRVAVLTIQPQMPAAVSRNDATCEEIYSFGNSEVIFRQGLVSGYHNRDQNLRVH
jgi:hypothetical protein